MNTIQISTKSSDFETICITLDEPQVTALYEQNKELNKTIAELTTKLERSEQNLKYTTDNKNDLQTEKEEANTLLTALGVQEKTTNEETYYRKDLKLSTRIALYIATNK